SSRLLPCACRSLDVRGHRAFIPSATEASLSRTENIRPILADNKLGCHAPGAKERRVARRLGRGAGLGVAVGRFFKPSGLRARTDWKSVLRGEDFLPLA